MSGSTTAWKIERVAGPFSGETHGPLWDGEAVLVAVPAENRILRYHPGTGRIGEVRSYTSGNRGLAFDSAGRLFGCQTGARRIARFNKDGSASMLADRIEGRLHHQPYDLAIDERNRIWFTDGEPIVMSPRIMEKPIDYVSVLRIDRTPDAHWSIRRMTHDTRYPMGIAFSPDRRRLYVTDNAPDGSAPPELRAYPLLDDDSLGSPSVVCSFVDAKRARGICVAADGNVVVCLGADGDDARVALVSPAGDILEQLRFEGGEPTNCAFGGSDSPSLYVTCTDGCLYRVPSFAC